MMREAKARIAIWQKRTKSLRAQQEPGMMIVICTFLFSKFDSDVRKDVLNAAGRDASSVDDKSVPNGTQRVMIDFEYMKSIVELVKRVDDQQKPSPMELGSFAEVHDYAEYVHWNDQGSPEWQKSYEDWTPECAQGYEAQWSEDTQRLAAIAEADASRQDALDAINGKGGNGGKGGKAKGKGKGKGKLGKRKGKDMTSQAYRPPTQTQSQTGTQVETRQC